LKSSQSQKVFALCEKCIVLSNRIPCFRHGRLGGDAERGTKKAKALVPSHFRPIALGRVKLHPCGRQRDPGDILYILY